MKKLVFAGAKSLGVACLKHLVNESVKLNIEIVGVLIGQRDGDGLDDSVCLLAETLGLEVISDLNSFLDLALVHFLISVQYSEIFKAIHLDHVQDLAINLHMAPLPRYRGCNQFTHALINGDKQFGTTLHVMTEKIDHGRILSADYFDIPKPDSIFVGELVQLTSDRSFILFEQSIASILNGDNGLIPVLNEVDEPTTYHDRDEIDGLRKLDWGWDKEKIERHIRAMALSGKPGPYVYIAGKRVNFVLEDH
jgi:methionyl-tRNA formyltransferase